jgi:hypothetical protein
MNKCEMNMRVTREVQYNRKIIHVIMSTHKSAVCRNITTNSTKCLILLGTNIYL